MKIVLIGYGRMGQTIEQLALEQGAEIVARINSSAAAKAAMDLLKTADVAIEFSRPESAVANLLLCFEAGLPVVSGTTGWLDHLEEVKMACNKANGAFFYASNFSIGVNIFFALNRYLAHMMDAYPQYQINLEEIHHTGKLDAPSGTAISLAKDIIQKISRKKNWINHLSQQEAELSIVSKRVEKVPGTHQISYESAIDNIEIKHTAHSREGFARGAIQAAQWLIGKKGCFGMEDMLGLS